MTTGTTFASFYTSFTRRGLSSELVFESPEADLNLARYGSLLVRKGEMEAAYGGALDWQELPDRKATRVADYLPDVDVTTEDRCDEYLAWSLDRHSRLRAALAAVGGVSP